MNQLLQLIWSILNNIEENMYSDKFKIIAQNVYATSEEIFQRVGSSGNAL